MRRLFFLLALITTIFACEKQYISYSAQGIVGDGQMELQALSFCVSAYDIGDETGEEWAQRVVDDVVNVQGVEILEFSLDYFEPYRGPRCGNCDPSGDILRVTVAEADEETLRGLGFQD